MALNIICITFVLKTKYTEMELLGNMALVNYAGWIGTPEIVIIVVIILLLFGGKKIPELMRGLGKGVKEFKDGVGDDAKKDTTDTKETKKE